MPAYPIKVEVDEAKILKLTKVYQSAYIQIVGEINTATNFGVANRKAILAQIDGILKQLGKDTTEFLKDELPGYYEVGADEAVKQLHNVGADVNISEGFNRIHREAISALVDDTAKAFGESITGVSRSARLLLGKATREALTQQLAKGLIGGDALREVKKQIKLQLQDQGLTALKDKGGKSWSLDRYAEMLFRTKAVESRNRGLANRMVENDYDLVQVSDHTGECPLCAPWEGKILSLTGATAGYPTLAEAESDGLFHPNCRHAINALIPSLAKATRAYYQDEKTRIVSEAEISRLS